MYARTASLSSHINAIGELPEAYHQFRDHVLPIKSVEIGYEVARERKDVLVAFCHADFPEQKRVLALEGVAVDDD